MSCFSAALFGSVQGLYGPVQLWDLKKKSTENCDSMRRGLGVGSGGNEESGSRRDGRVTAL